MWHKGLNRGFTGILRVDLDADAAGVVLTNGESGDQLWQPALTAVTSDLASPAIAP